MIQLPEEFTKRMEKMLGEEYQAFLKSYEKENIQGLRINPLKIEKKEFEEKNIFSCTPIPWCETGYFCDKEARPGRHPFHEAGMYYIQEPSAMSAAQLLEAKPFERVLDLCAAPGGKTTQIAGQMKGEGLLVANEIHPQRAKILSQNIERLGIKNALVTNADSKTLANHFPLYFDRILCDAPCSGEGMFRKDEVARKEWSLENVALCASRQREILKNVVAMLKPGGRLVYSTCTFSEEENEQTIVWLVKEEPSMVIEHIEDGRYKAFSKGCSKYGEELTSTFRLFPHRLEGEGHYVAVLQKEGKAEKIELATEKIITAKDKSLKLYKDWEKENLLQEIDTDYLLFGTNLYAVPKEFPRLKGLKVLRPGLQLGSLEKKNFKPAHALAMALKKEEVKNFVDYSAGAKEISGYLRGETIPCKAALKGWVLVCVEGVSLGWGKASNGMIKNHYPKGLRVLWKD